VTPPANGAPAGEVRPADTVAGSPIMRNAPEAVRPYLELARIDRPIGWWLLLLPCWWSAALAADAAGRAYPQPLHLLLFFIGAVVMRAAGSTWNDIVDRKLDGSVARTRGRPLPSGRLTLAGAITFGVALSLAGLAVLLSFNRFTVLLGFCSLAPVVVYPFMKRVTFHPQLVLGLAFAWGALMGWAALFGSLSAAPVLLYAAAIAWTVGYDTIYALQDIEDDAIIGIGSTARAYEGHVGLFIALCYLVAVALLVAALVMAGASPGGYCGAALFAGHLAWQVARLQPDDPQRALILFRSNRDAGLLLFGGLVAGSLISAL
jgi:4-hydroxybenzoate polyprenyltransferase